MEPPEGPALAKHRRAFCLGVAQGARNNAIYLPASAATLKQLEAQQAMAYVLTSPILQARMPARSAMSALVDGPIAIRLAADGQIDSRPRCLLTCGRAHPLAGALRDCIDTTV
jgi:hypothetical protein